VRELFSVRTRTWRYPFGSSAIVGSYVASGGNPVAASRRAAKTRGIATPAFTGCAFIVRNGALVSYRVMRVLSS